LRRPHFLTRALPKFAFQFATQKTFQLQCRVNEMSAFVEPAARQALGKNSEKFDILQSHNQLPARYLQKTDKPSIYNNAENGESIRRRRDGYRMVNVRFRFAPDAFFGSLVAWYDRSGNRRFSAS
jgi:hypothetical protein